MTGFINFYELYKKPFVQLADKSTADVQNVLGLWKHDTGSPFSHLGVTKIEFIGTSELKIFTNGF